MKLIDKLENVVDLDTFLDFVQSLIDDWEQKETNENIREIEYETYRGGEWQNVTIGEFLEAAHAWARVTKMGELQGNTAAPAWKSFAIFLYMGKIYE